MLRLRSRLTRFQATSKLFFAASLGCSRLFATTDSPLPRSFRIFASMVTDTRFPPRGMQAAAVIFLLLTLTAHAFAQTAPEPERETLLNGLRILYWQQPGNSNVLLKLRVHSGAAFDLAGKAGMMALFGDALFPDPATREYVTEELGGKLEVTTTYDSIDVTLSGKASALERMIDLLRGAVLSTQLDADTIAKLRQA